MRSLVAAYLTLVLPPIGSVIAIVTWNSNQRLRVNTLAVTFLLFVLTSLGVTAGFHRLFTHRSFIACRSLRIFLGILGSMAAQGPLIYWVGAHRKHHQFSDERSDDPHSPLEFEGEAFGTLRGIWHAHVGWMLTRRRLTFARYCPDLLRDSECTLISQLYLPCVLVGLLLPGAIVSWSCPGVRGAWMQGILWGGLVRILLVHHTTWSVNSICHKYGYRNFDTRDNSRNNAIVACLTFGEGWHNNHHAFPRAARHGFTKWELDATWLFISLLKMMRLASNPVLPKRLDLHSAALEERKDEGSLKHISATTLREL